MEQHQQQQQHVLQTRQEQQMEQRVTRTEQRVTRHVTQQRGEPCPHLPARDCCVSLFVHARALGIAPLPAPESSQLQIVLIIISYYYIITNIIAVTLRFRRVRTRVITWYR